MALNMILIYVLSSLQEISSVVAPRKSLSRTHRSSDRGLEPTRAAFGLGRRSERRDQHVKLSASEIHDWLSF